MATPPVLPDGSTIGQYRTISMVGQGGFGTVYKAQNQNMPDWIRAIKELHFSDASALKRFQQEAQLLMAINHKNIPRIYDYIVEKNRHYIIMDWIEGHTLSRVAYLRQLTENELVAVGLECTSALMYLHTRPQPIFHRDIKPENLMFVWGAAFHGWLMDLGIAKVAGTLQQKRSVVGTRNYSSPQQQRGEEPEAGDDIFGLGASWYEVMAPFNLPWDKMVIPFPYERLDGPAEVAATLDRYPQFSQTFRNIVLKCLAYNRSDRFSSAADLYSALESLSAPLDPLAFTPPPPIVPPPAGPSASFDTPVNKQQGWNPLRPPTK